jgi:hypothetical protein
MHKAVLLALLVVGLVSVAAVPQSRADSTCVPISKTTNRGSFAADFCLDPASGQIQVTGTATLADGTQVGVSAGGSVTVSFGHGSSASWSLDINVVVTDSIGGSVVHTKSLSITGNSFPTIVQKLTDKLANLSI